MSTYVITIGTPAIEELCSMYYKPKTYEHAKRVAAHASAMWGFIGCNNLSEEARFTYQLGLIHDLYEDTDIKRNIWFGEPMESNLELLTKEKGADYNEYLSNIKKHAYMNKIYLPAYVVKLADMWDHLNEKETLTQDKKDKYIEGLPYLL